VQVEQTFNGATWKSDTAYRNNLNQWCRIKSISFYMSGFQMFKGTQPLEVLDSIFLKTFGNTNDTTTQLFRDDFVLFRRGPNGNSNFENPVGTFRSSGIFDQAKLYIGLSDAHPLARQTDSLWLSQQEGYVWMRMVVARDSAAATVPDTLNFTKADFGTPLLLQGTDMYEQGVGFDLKFTFAIDYYELLNGVNFINDPVLTWKSKIIANLPNSVLITR
jgi:hypothetical protein